MRVTISAQPENRLIGRQLTLGVARGVWIGVVALTLGLYLFSIPLQLAYYQIVCSGAACPNAQISPAGLQQLQQAGLSLGFYAGYYTALTTIIVLVFSIVAAVIFWRNSDDWIGLFASLALVLAGSGITFNSNALALAGKQYPALLFLGPFLTVLGGTSFFLFFFLFPDGRFAPRWIVWLVPLVVVHEVLSAFRPELLGIDLLLPVELVSVIFAQIYRHQRVSNSVQRQQTKWVVFGAVVGVGGTLGLIVYSNIAWPGGNAPTVVSALIWLTGFYLFILLIPLSIGMAILRSHLWDIDLLIRRTLVYAALTGVLALAYFASVVALQSVLRVLTGQGQSQAVTVISTLAIAALFVPVRRRVQAFIDRRFYRRKYDAARTLAAFSNSVRDEVELGRLAERLTEVVDDTLQPESVTLWLKKPEPVVKP